MITAIASTTKDLSGEISDQGARAPYYLLINKQNEILEAIKKSFCQRRGWCWF